jgi:hypothetical protein
MRMISTILAVALSALCTPSIVACKEPALGTPMPPASASAATSLREASTFAGTVLETMDSGGYTYIKLSTPEGERWAAVSLAKVKVGDPVTIVDATVMTDFEAKSLGRKFDRIIFGTLGGAPPPVSAHGGKRSDSRQSMAQIPKPSGADGRTVAEVWAERVELKDKQVAVHGKVVKFNSGIMGKNWLHLQDGTGTQEASNFDLAVTTNDQAAVGDVIVVRGVVHVDKDFGAGYSYPVLVEEAKIER